MINETQKEWRELISNDDDAIILDVRTPDEFAEGIIENALMINFLNPPPFMERIVELDKNKSYYIYCRSGNRSKKACLLMDELGFKKTFNLIGGIMSWTGKIVIP